MILGALVAMYIVLGVLYESLAHPITIISTLPSAGLGALLALQVTNTPLTVIAFIGIILLIGIVKKNGIMMVDFALDAERNRGLSSAEAIFEACSVRFRPILMTTMAAAFAGIPLVIATGPGTELRRPLGITIIGGLFVSQILTLYTTPVIYLLIDRFKDLPRSEKLKWLGIIGGIAGGVAFGITKLALRMSVAMSGHPRRIAVECQIPSKHLKWCRSARTAANRCRFASAIPSSRSRTGSSS